MISKNELIGKLNNDWTLQKRQKRLITLILEYLVGNKHRKLSFITYALINQILSDERGNMYYEYDLSIALD